MKLEQEFGLAFRELRKDKKMPDLTKMGMTKAEIRKEAEEIHNKNVEEIKNTLPPEVSAVFLEAYDNFVVKCYEETYIEDDDNNYLLDEYFKTFVKTISKMKDESISYSPIR